MPAFSDDEPSEPRWPLWLSLAAFLAGVACIVTHFVVFEPEGSFLPFLLLFVGPMLFGIAGLALAIMVRSGWLIVLNLLPPIVFPAIMFFGTLVLGP